MALTPLRGICCLLCVRRLIEGKSREWWEGRHLTDRNNRIWQQPKTGCFQRLHLELASNVLMLVPGQRIVLRFACRQYPAQTTDRQDAGGLTARLCLTQAGHSPKFLLHREIFQIFRAGLAAKEWLLDLGPLPSTTGIATETPRVDFPGSRWVSHFSGFGSYLVHTSHLVWCFPFLDFCDKCWWLVPLGLQALSSVPSGPPDCSFILYSA